jgi:type IX secretion system PorP/SprF family membrane protein
LYNPALVALKNDMNANVSYRTQWRSVGAPYSAVGASFESTLQPKRGQTKGHIALGFNAYREQMSRHGEVHSFSLNAVKHLVISKQSTISFGMNLGLFGASFNADNGMWESQHNGLFYDENLQSGEVFDANQLMSFDVGTGMVYSARSKDNELKSFQVGVSAFHLSRPDISVVSNGTSRLPIRAVLHTSFTLPLGKKGSYLESSLLFQNQQKFNSFMLGAMANFKLKEKAKTTSSDAKVNALYAGFGIYLRAKDALIFNAQVRKTNWTFALAYDLTVSTLRGNSRGATEVQLRYTIPSYRKQLMF